MRVTFLLAAADTSGGCRVVAAHAANLMDRGHDVLVVAAKPRPEKLRKRVKLMARAILHGHAWPNFRAIPPNHFDGTSIPRVFLTSPRPISARDLPDADVVIATWWETAEWVADLPRTKGAKVYFIQHHETELGQPAERVEATWRLPMKKITCSQWLAELARDRFGDAEATVVMNGIDHGTFYAGPRPKQAVPTVGLVYSTNRSKGCDVSLKAFSLAAERRPGIRLLAFGAEPVSSWMPLPPNSSFEFRPAQSRIREIYTSCDAWLYGSRSEGFGLPVLEAMACGTPVIGTRAGVAAELISDRTGSLVDFDNPEEMADALIDVLDSSSERWGEMSKAAREVAEGYTWERATDLFEAALISGMESANASATKAQMGS